MTEFNKLIAANGDDGYSNGSTFYAGLNTCVIGKASLTTDSFLRFTNVTIPKGAIINSAVVRLRADFSDSATVFRTNIYIEDSDNPNAPTSESDLNGREVGSAVAWDGEGSWIDGNDYDSPDFSGILQTHFARSGWASGQALIVLILDDGSDDGARRIFKARELTTVNCAQLRVDYDSPPPEITEIETIIVQELTAIKLDFSGELNAGENVAVVENSTVKLDTKQIAAGADDGQARNNGDNFTNTAQWGYLGNVNAVLYHEFLRFASVGIPKGSIISSAVLRFKSTSNYTADTVRVAIHIEDADDPAAPTNGTDLIGRSLQTKVNWDFSTNWVAGSLYNSVDFSAALQTHLGRAGWNSGQAITFHLLDDGSTYGAYRRFYSYDTDPAYAVELLVTYSEGPEPNETDTIAVSESTAIELEFLGELQSNDNIAIVENSTIGLDKLTSQFDNVGVSELIGVDLFSFWHEPQGGDDLAIVEYFNVDFYSYFYEPQAIENPIISESVTVALDALGAGVVENIAVIEYIGYPAYGETAEDIGIADAISAFNWSAWFAANKNKAIPKYYFTLTGEADATTDAVIPISSFQARKRTGNPTYLAVVIPGFDYAQQITDRSSGEMVIEIGYEIDGTIEFSEEILRATLEEIRTDQGANNRSISLTGHKTETFSTQIATLENSIYRSIQGGNLVHRFAEIDPFLNPGDTCRTGADEFTVDYIIYMVNAFQTVMEVREG